jgi:hypothetical protein
MPTIMIIKPPKTMGIIIGILLLIILLSGIVVGIIQLSVGEIGPLLGLWTSIVILGLPLLLFVGYRLYGLISARYVINRDGFYLQWGFSSEQIPLTAIEDIVMGNNLEMRLMPPIGFWWPGCVVGHREVEGFGRVEFFATTPSKDQVIIPLTGRSLAISPPDPKAFQQAFLDDMRLGSLEEIPRHSVRPEFFSTRLWDDRFARYIILLGLILALSLLGYLAIRIPGLPDQVPFGYDLSGKPDTFVPPSQLILLPIVGGFFWFTDFLIGAWLFRQDRNQKISYLVWLAGVVLTVLLWGAVLQLITT